MTRSTQSSDLPILDELGADLDRAWRQADRVPSPRPRWRVAAVAAAVLLVAAAAAGAALSLTGTIGGPPTVRHADPPSHAGLGLARRSSPVVLAVGRLPSGIAFELSGWAESDSTGQTHACLSLDFPSLGFGGHCLNENELAQGVLAPEPGRESEASSVIVNGAARLETDVVRLRYRVRGKSGESRASLVKVSEEDARRVGTSAFGFYVGEVPVSARMITAEGRSSTGEVLWDARFER